MSLAVYSFTKGENSLTKLPIVDINLINVAPRSEKCVPAETAESWDIY